MMKFTNHNVPLNISPSHQINKQYLRPGMRSRPIIPPGDRHIASEAANTTVAKFLAITYI